MELLLPGGEKLQNFWSLTFNINYDCLGF